VKKDAWAQVRTSEIRLRLPDGEIVVNLPFLISAFLSLLIMQYMFKFLFFYFYSLAACFPVVAL
jgi:hypothetical protein